MLQPNTPAPDFETQTDQDETLRLSDLRGQWVVLYFYPKAMTSGCTRQAQNLRDDYSEYQKYNVTVLGCSPDPVKKLAQFRDKEDLPFRLIADEDHQIAEAYDVWVEKNMYGRKFWGTERTTYLINPAGIIEQVFPKVRPAEHSNKVLAALKDVEA
jgi:peroxiredoxin Q/BCP